jgi:hypothetical protein
VAATNALGPPPGWVDPGTSIPGVTATATPTDCSADQLKTIFWRGWNSAAGANAQSFVVKADTVRFSQDRRWALFTYEDTTGRFPDAQLVADCEYGYWQLGGVVAEIDCAVADQKYMAIFVAAYRELGVC